MQTLIDEMISLKNKIEHQLDQKYNQSYNWSGWLRNLNLWYLEKTEELPNDIKTIYDQFKEVEKLVDRSNNLLRKVNSLLKK